MKRKSLFKIIFCIYIIFLFVFVVFKFTGSFTELQNTIRSTKWSREAGAWNYNLILFRSIKSQFFHFDSMWAMKNLVANIVAFIPLGFLIPIVFISNAKFYRTVLICLISILLIESMQFITMLGSFDVDDILLNLIGCILGYFCYVIYNKIIVNPLQ